MYFLIATYLGLTALTQNGQVTAGPFTTVTPFSTLASCQLAQAAITAHAIGNYRVFADCVAQ